MAAPHLRNTIYSDTEDAIDDDDRMQEEFFPGERIGGLPRRRGLLSRLFAWSLVAALVYGGWMVLRDRPPWFEQITADLLALGAALDTKTAQPQQPETSNIETAAIPQPVEEQVVPEAPTVEAGEPVAATTNVSPEEVEQLPSEPTTTPAAERTDPYEKKAEAVGLNPDVSKVLLKKMTADDYRNAGIAIKTALAETPDDGIFNYPREKKGGLAQFQVHFVPGAAEQCRRYVVTVTKERWSTTALPMEKCGIAAPQRSEKAAAKTAAQ